MKRLSIAILTGILIASIYARINAQPSTEVSGSLSSATSVNLNAPGMGGAAFQITGTWSGTITFEGSIDCLFAATPTYTALNVYPTNSTTAQTTTTANGIFQASTAGLACARARVSTYTSGTVNIRIRSSTSSVKISGSGGGGGGTIGGSIANTQIAVGSGTNTITGSSFLTTDLSTQLAQGGSYGTDTQLTSFVGQIISADAITAGWTIYTAGDLFVEDPVLILASSGGTRAAPTLSVYNTYIGEIDFFGHTGTALAYGAAFWGSTSQDWTSTANGTRIFFAANKDGETGGATPFLTFNGPDPATSPDNSIILGRKTIDMPVVLRGSTVSIATTTNPGVSNSGFPITLSGAFATTGAFNLTIGVPSSSTWNLTSGGGTIPVTSNNLSVFSSTTSAQLAGVISNETGTGLVVFNTSPTLVTPALGTPSAAVLTNATGLPEAGLSLTDITTNNVSATAHGFAPKFPNNTTTFLRGDGTYASAPGCSQNCTITETAGNSALTLTGATQTVSNPVLNMTQTWNAGGVAFTGVKLNVTNTASSSLSALMSLQVGGSQQFYVKPNGNIGMTGSVENEIRTSADLKADTFIVVGNVTTTSPLYFGSGTDTQLLREASSQISVKSGAGAAYAELKLRSLVVGGTVPGISGCSAGTQTGGGTAGTFSSGTTGTCTVVLTFAFTAPTGWNCLANDRTTPADLIGQTTSTTTTCTVSGSTLSGDVIGFTATAY